MTLPPIPSTVHSVLGAIPVKRVKSLPAEDGSPSNDLGEFSYHDRTIRLVRGMDRTQAHHTLRHEWAHAILFDSGLHTVLEKYDGLEELLCDVFATAIVAEMIAGRIATGQKARRP